MRPWRWAHGKKPITQKSRSAFGQWIRDRLIPTMADSGDKSFTGNPARDESLAQAMEDVYVAVSRGDYTELAEHQPNGKPNFDLICFACPFKKGDTCERDKGGC